jgi:BON domain-containing protein
MSSTTRVAPTVAGAIAAGAAGAYFLDPDNGKRRRHIARDRALALIRRPARTAVREAERRAKYAQGVVAGAVHDVTTSGGDRDASRLNDPALAAKVESEVFRAPDSPKQSVSVNVEGGVVYLRGELGSREDIDGLVAATKQVDGVDEVRSMLHLPGEEPPAKEVAGNGAGS